MAKASTAAVTVPAVATGSAASVVVTTAVGATAASVVGVGGAASPTDTAAATATICRRSSCAGRLLFGFWVGSLLSTHFHGIDPRLVLQYEDLVDSLTSEAVQQAAQRYFDLDNYVRVVLYPEGFGE